MAATAAAASVVAITGGSLTIAYCQEHKEFKLERRRVTKGVRDPMTSYELYAEQKQGGETTGEKDDSSLQATSAAVDVSPLPLGPDTGALTPAEQSLEEATRKAKQHSGGLKVFSGNGNMSLALEISRHLGVNLGRATVGRFADGEVNVVIHENVRGKDVYIVQPTCPPVNDNVIELLLMVSTLRRASARRITVVIPYYGYARQDRKMQVSGIQPCWSLCVVY